MFSEREEPEMPGEKANEGPPTPRTHAQETPRGIPPLRSTLPAPSRLSPGHFYALACAILVDGKIPRTKRNVDSVCFLLYAAAQTWMRGAQARHSSTLSKPLSLPSPLTPLHAVELTLPCEDDHDSWGDA